jgi:hypothetical protein
MERQIAWTPEGGNPQTMAVLLPRQDKPLTLEAYQEHLRRRYEHLVRQSKQEGRDPLAMAQEQMAQWDDLTPSNSREIPEMLATRSETLMTNFPMGQFPVPQSKVTETRAAREAVRLVRFSDLLTAIYPTA